MQRFACLMACLFCSASQICWPSLGLAQEFSAGAYAQDITPPRFPISVNGNMADHLAKGAHDPLHARCLVLHEGKTSLALVTCDSCMIPREIMDSAKRRAAYRTGIPATNILISATHAHSCPTSAGVFQSDPDAEYIVFLADRITEGIETAWKRRVPAQVAWGTAIDDTQLFNRRWKYKDGVLGENPFGQKVDQVRMNPGYSNPDVTSPAGPIDPQITLLSVQTREGKPLALWANYSLHYVGGVPGDFVSADYFGEFAQRMSRRLKANEPASGFVACMTNGTSGDVNNVNFSLTAGPKRAQFEQIGVVAESVSERAAQAIAGLKYRTEVKLAAAEREVELGVRKPSEEDLGKAKTLLANMTPPLKGLPAIYARETVLLADFPATVKAKIQALAIGDLAIVSSPCETFTETGLSTRKESPFPVTCTISLANGYNGYLPTPQQHAWGGYETWRARSSYLATDAEPIIRKTQLDLLKSLRP